MPMSRRKQFTRWVWRYIVSPPRGLGVRRVIVGILLAVGIPRLPFAHDVLPFAGLQGASPEVFGIVGIAIGLLMLATTYHWRLSLPGRIAAGLAFVFFCTLAVATNSATSLIVDITMAWAAFGEMVAMDES